MSCGVKLEESCKRISSGGNFSRQVEFPNIKLFYGNSYSKIKFKKKAVTAQNENKERLHLFFFRKARPD